MTEYDRQKDIEAEVQRATMGSSSSSTTVTLPRIPTDRMMVMGGFSFAGKVPNSEVYPEVLRFWERWIAEADRMNVAEPASINRPAGNINKAIERFEKAVIANGWRHKDSISEKEYAEAKAELLAALSS